MRKQVKRRPKVAADLIAGGNRTAGMSLNYSSCPHCSKAIIFDDAGAGSIGNEPCIGSTTSGQPNEVVFRVTNYGTKR